MTKLEQKVVGKVIDYDKLVPLDDLTLAKYNAMPSWEWWEVLYLLNSFKPPFDNRDAQAEFNFPEGSFFMGRAFPVGDIGIETIRVGIKTYFDTPANWIRWWKEKGLTSKTHLPQERPPPGSPASQATVSKPKKTSAEQESRMLAGLKKGREAAAKKRKKDREERDATINKVATETWQKNPSWSVLDMVRHLQKNNIALAKSTLETKLKGIKSRVLKTLSSPNPR